MKTSPFDEIREFIREHTEYVVPGLSLLDVRSRRHAIVEICIESDSVTSEFERLVDYPKEGETKCPVFETYEVELMTMDINEMIEVHAEQQEMLFKIWVFAQKVFAKLLVETGIHVRSARFAGRKTTVELVDNVEN